MKHSGHLILFLSWFVVTSAMSTKNGIQNITNMEDFIQHANVSAAASPVQSLAQNNTGTSSTNAVVNTYVLTLFNYENNQVYVYSPKSNTDENKNDFKKWIFYYVPVMLPLKRNESDTQWIWSVKNEIRLKLIVSNKEVEESARKAISNKFDTDIVKNYSKYWDVAPLMIDSLTAYIVRGDSSPAVGVQQYHAIHPTTLIMTLRFQCTTDEIAQETVEKIIDGDYEIEVSLYFAEFKQVKTNFASITADQVRSVLSKTIADGGDTKPEYIHRNQASNFVGKYLTNVKKMIYIEDASLNTSALTAGLEDQFFSLFQQGMENSEQTILDVGLYGQLWSSSDLNPDRLTSELHNLFSKNDSETKRRNDSNTYFSLNTQYLQESANSNEASASVSGGGWGVSAAISGSTSSSSSNSLQNQLAHTTHDIFSKDDIEKLLAEQQITMEWNGEKFEPKSFKVYKLTDLTNQLQVAIIAKQLSVDKTRGAIIRTINTLNTLTKESPTKNGSEETKVNPSVFLTGIIQMYAGNKTPTKQWLLCNGSNVSRIEYKRLFSVVGETYGAGDGNTTFSLPDFRGRVPVGADDLQINVAGTGKLGSTGGQALHQLTIDQLPPHNHSAGSLSTSWGGSHSHSIDDRGHDHGGRTGDTAPFGKGGWGMTRTGHGSDQQSHSHTIPTGVTNIKIDSAGTHSHNVAYGETNSVGLGEQFSLMQPYQIVNYIIYAG